MSKSKNCFLNIEHIIDVPAGSPNNKGIGKDKDRFDIRQSKSIQGDGVGGRRPYISSQSVKRRVREEITGKDPAYDNTTNTEFKDADKKSKEWERLKKDILIEEDGKLYKRVGEISTTGDPAHFVDDDLFGYMRIDDKITRTRPAPYRITPAVAVADRYLEDDFGVIQRAGLHPLPYKTNIYRSALHTSSLLHLTAVGTYWAGGPHVNILGQSDQVAGLDDAGVILGSPAFRINLEERQRRASLVPEALANLDTGPDSTLRMVSYRPPILISTVCEGASLPFRYAIQSAEDRKEPCKIDWEAFIAGIRSHADVIQSTVYVGWDTGYAPESRAVFLKNLELNKDSIPDHITVIVDESRICLNKQAEDLRKPEAGILFG